MTDNKTLATDDTPPTVRARSNVPDRPPDTKRSVVPPPGTDAAVLAASLRAKLDKCPWDDDDDIALCIANTVRREAQALQMWPGLTTERVIVEAIKRIRANERAKAVAEYAARRCGTCAHSYVAGDSGEDLFCEESVGGDAWGTAFSDTTFSCSHWEPKP